MKDWLFQELAYNLWANRLWLAFLLRLPDAEKALEIFNHMLTEQRLWVQRCDCDPLPPESEDFLVLLQAYYDAWMQVSKKRQLAEHVVYRDAEGGSFVRPFAEIALHVINDGAFHRGQIKATMDAQSVVGYPKTPLIVYFDHIRSGQ